MPGLFWALGFLGFPFQLGLQGGWGSRRGWGAKSHCIGLQQWLALSGPDIRRVIVKPMLIAQEKAAFKSISMLNWVCVYDMARIPHYWTHLCPPPPPPPPFHSRVVEQDPGEIIELQLWNKLDSVSTEQSGAAACRTSSWAALTTLSVRGGKVERKRGKRPLRGASALLMWARLGGLVHLLGLVFQTCLL